MRWAAGRFQEDVSEPSRRRSGLEYFANARERPEGEASGEREAFYADLHYRRNIAASIAILQEAGARVMLVTLSQNFADWRPGASAHRAGLSDEDRAAWEAAWDEARRLRGEEGCARALEPYGRALLIDPEHAELRFEIAECERTLGRYESAYEHFRAASDLDRVPHGAHTRLNEIVRELALEHGALIVDVEALLEASSPGRLVGDDRFTDLVHPNLYAHQIIAKALAQTMREAGIPEPGERWVGGYEPPPVSALYDADPQLRVREHLVRAAACSLADREDCVLGSVRAALAIDPNNEIARRVLERSGLAQAAAASPSPGPERP